ncbi:MAG TPA: DUF5110 domain-containing protein, partial [Anditalea sp.]|nr:DUF5110 domain-containing protein [Anditalea sp.]
FDYWDCKKYEGSKYYNVETPLEKLPIYVKAGAIIPMQDEVYKDDNRPFGNITLDIFPGAKGTFNLYEDDGLSEDYTTGEFAITKVETSSSNNTSKISIYKSDGQYQVPERSYILKIRSDESPKAVSIGNKILNTGNQNQIVSGTEGWWHDSEESILWVSVNKKSDQQVDINIQ